MDKHPDVPVELFFGLGGMMLVLMIIVALWLTLVIWSMVWVYQDANARGRSGILLAFLMWFTWPIGLIVWLVARPEFPYRPQPMLRSQPPPLPDP